MLNDDFISFCLSDKIEIDKLSALVIKWKSNPTFGLWKVAKKSKGELRSTVLSPTPHRHPKRFSDIHTYYDSPDSEGITFTGELNNKYLIIHPMFSDIVVMIAATIDSGSNSVEIMMGTQPLLWFIHSLGKICNQITVIGYHFDL